MKGNDLVIRPFIVLDQLEVIWPHHVWKCDLRGPPWPQQWLFPIQCHVTYKMKGIDFSIRPFNVLDQLEVICWPHHDKKCDLRWPPWPKQWFLCIPCHVTYQMEGNDFSIWTFFYVIYPLEVIWPHYANNRWPPWPQQRLFHIPCHVTHQMKGNNFSIRPLNVSDRLEVIWSHHDWKCDLRLTTTMTFSYPMSCDISNERYWLQYSTFKYSRPIGGHLTSPWPKMWPQITSMATTMTFS